MTKTKKRNLNVSTEGSLGYLMTSVFTLIFKVVNQVFIEIYNFFEGSQVRKNLPQCTSILLAIRLTAVMCVQFSLSNTTNMS